jgi:hypothetical protein
MSMSGLTSPSSGQASNKLVLEVVTQCLPLKSSVREMGAKRLEPRASILPV